MIEHSKRIETTLKNQQYLIAIPNTTQVIRLDDKVLQSKYATIQRVRIEECGELQPFMEFATKVSKFIEWKCNYCKVSKSSGAPHKRKHFLGGNG